MESMTYQIKWILRQLNPSRLSDSALWPLSKSTHGTGWADNAIDGNAKSILWWRVLHSHWVSEKPMVGCKSWKNLPCNQSSTVITNRDDDNVGNRTVNVRVGMTYISPVVGQALPTDCKDVVASVFWTRHVTVVVTLSRIKRDATPGRRSIWVISRACKW